MIFMAILTNLVAGVSNLILPTERETKWNYFWAGTCFTSAIYLVLDLYKETFN
jgi:hypothetical protein